MACVQYTAGTTIGVTQSPGITTGGTQPQQASSGTGTLLLLVGVAALAMMLMGGKK